MRRLHNVFLIIPLLSALFPVVSITWGSSKSTPEASSTLLELHRLYQQQPPHDRALYDRLNVSPNATASVIRRNYLKLSRQYHPDKQRDESTKQYTMTQLERVREAYEILKDDKSRLPYHRYGLLDMRQAIILLTGQHHDAAPLEDPSLQALLQLMGYPTTMHEDQNWQQNYDTDNYYYHQTPLMSNMPTSKHDRTWYIAVRLVERMRPYVEGRVSAQTLAERLAEECDLLKRLALGASILRCIGRAYRYEGGRYLRKHRVHAEQRYHYQHGFAKGSHTKQIVADVSETVRFHWRNAKHLATAAVASGKCIVAEQQHKLGYYKRKVDQAAAQATTMYQQYQGGSSSNGNQQQPIIGQLHDEDPLPSDEDMRLEAKLKAQRVIIESLQIEALWKVSKMELDQIVRDACRLILSGEYFFFFPSQQHPVHQHDYLHYNQRSQYSDGWVGSAGVAIDAHLGRLRAAQALMLMGDVMVARSKEGTAWMQ
ncbi:hypothetical protein MPSEU_000824800 [Mayamaea pseudoterrestris]|nr:hypothetical protein MPSEU_000824800 [Mayamaea pseudoterrestris]